MANRLRLVLAIEEGHNSACRILNCNHYIPGDKTAEISHSLQFSLGHWAVKSARAMGKKESRQGGDYLVHDTHAGIWKEL